MRSLEQQVALRRLTRCHQQEDKLMQPFFLESRFVQVGQGQVRIDSSNKVSKVEELI